MKLDEFLEVLAHGEIAGTSIVDMDTALIPVEQYPKVISFINRGLLQLYTLFLLKEDIVTIRHLDNKTTYFIDSQFADTNGGPNPYIVDSVFKPYTDNLLMIEYINDELGDPVVINDYDDPLSYFTPGHKNVEVNLVNPNTVFHVIYRARHDKIALQPADTSLVDIVLPDNFIDALIYYVASKCYASTNSTDSRKISVALHQQFFAEISMLKATGQGTLNFNPLPEDVRKRGWL